MPADAFAHFTMVSLVLIHLFLWSGFMGFGVNPGEFQAQHLQPRFQAAQVWPMANGASRQSPTPPVPMPSTYAPQPGDAPLQRGGVSIEKVALTEMSGGNGQLVTITGSLPTPCHSLRLQIPAMASADGVLRIHAWSISDPAVVCAQVVQPFSAQFPIRVKADGGISVNDVMP